MKKIILKNKKGFTLVELLAVIAILAILVVIVIPNVLQLFNESKLKVFKSESQTIYKTAEQDLLKRAIKNGGSHDEELNYSSCGETGTAKLNLMNEKSLQYKIKVVSGVIKEFRVYDPGTKFKIEIISTSSVEIQQVINAEIKKNEGPVCS